MKRGAWIAVIIGVLVALMASCSGERPAQDAPPATPPADAPAVEAANPTAAEPASVGSPTPAAEALPQATPTLAGAVAQPATVQAQPTAAEPAAAAADAVPTPACTPGQGLTPADMEGPYYLPGSQERSSLLEPGMSGTPLVVSGYVLRADCSPVAGARLDFWQADAGGEYDLQGYRLRGYVTSDERGFYRIETVLPAVYGGRPRHIHVKIFTEAGELTSQLYFPGDSPSPTQTVNLVEAGQSAAAYYTFVLP